MEFKVNGHPYPIRNVQITDPRSGVGPNRIHEGYIIADGNVLHDIMDLNSFTLEFNSKCYTNCCLRDTQSGSFVYLRVEDL